jgi:hypothetical protein
MVSDLEYERKKALQIFRSGGPQRFGSEEEQLEGNTCRGGQGWIIQVQRLTDI